MIDPKEYIQSGKLEEYVLGLGSGDLMQEVECMARVFPEIKDEIKALQLTFEQHALLTSQVPNEEVKRRILASIQDIDTLENTPKVLSESAESKEPATNNSLLKWLLALLALSTVFISYKYFSSSRQFEKTLIQTKLNETAAHHKIDSLNQIALTLKSQLEIITNPNSVAIKMTGTKLYQEGIATIYWDKSNQSVYLQPGNLPSTLASKQFQLWGIVDGKPVSLGVFDASSPHIQHMTSVTNASTFAVTLEPLGGSINPTLDQMYVAGNVTPAQ